MDNNGNILIKGLDLTPEQLQSLPFRMKDNPEAIKCHSFWFKNGLPSIELGFYYPVCHSLEFLPY
jgi:hypothetical protein